MEKDNIQYVMIPNQLARSGVGATNLAVLIAVLSRGKCYANLATIAKDAGVGRATATRAMKFWREHGEKHGVSVIANPRTGTTTEYTVTCTFVQKGGFKEVAHGEPTPAHGDEGVAHGDSPPRLTVSHKEDYLKKTTQEDHLKNLQPTAAEVVDGEVTTTDGRTTTDVSVKDVRRSDADIIEVFNAFKPVNPFPAYGNKTHRKAAADLVKMFGLNETIKAINVVISMIGSGDRYFPAISNPYDLREKWGKVAVHFKKTAPVGWDEILPDGSVITHYPKQ